MSRYIDVKWLEENAKEYSLGYYDYDEYAVPLSALDEAPSIEIPTWIPCSERLPSEKEIVLITNDKGNVRFGQFRGTHGKYWIWKGNTLETVLAWMPLPKPYKADRKTEPQRNGYDKGLQLFADILFDKEKSEQFLKECKSVGIDPQEREGE